MYFDILNRLGVDHQCDRRTDSIAIAMACLTTFATTLLKLISVANKGNKVQEIVQYDSVPRQSIIDVIDAINFYTCS